MVFKLRLPHYFSSVVRKEMGELYFSVAIADVALAMVFLFEPIFLYTVLGFTVQQILLFFAVVYAWYIVLIPFGARFVARVGFKKSIILSIPFQILYWVALFSSSNYSYLIYLAPLLFALEKTFFWPAFHALIAKFARRDQVGREFSVMQSLVNVGQILGPLLGGLIAQNYGLRASFIVAILVYVGMIFPLIWHQETYLPKVYKFRDTLILYKQFPLKMLGYFGFAEEMIVLSIWPLFIYLAVHNFSQTGLLVTLASLVATLLSLYIGKASDIFSKRRLIKIGTVLYGLVWLVRGTASTAWGAFSIDSLSRTTKDLVFIPTVSLTYERAESRQILPYVVFFEQSLAIGKLLGALLGILIFTFWGGFTGLFLFGALVTLLYLFI